MKELKPTDLRIGNYVTHCDYTDGIFKVESIAYQKDAVGGYVIDTIGGKNGTWSNPINCIEPIELTEEWLLRLGFEKIETEFFIDDWFLYISYHEGSCHILMLRDDYYFNTIQYVHQLQNLYFALTGQELEVKF
jgi:hypothetical protein